MAENLDISKMLTPQFFEGITSAYVDKLSRAFEAKLKDFSIKSEKVKEQKLDLNPLHKLFESFGASIGNVVKPPNKEVKEIADVEKPKTVIIGGFTDEGIAKMKKGLPSFVGGKVADNEKKPEKKPAGWIETLVLLLGEAYLLYKAFESSGPLKGALTLLSKIGAKVVVAKVTSLISGVVKAFNAIKSIVFGSIKEIEEVTVNVLKVAGKEGGSAIAKKEGGNIIGKMLGKIGGIFSKGFLKRVPIIGTAISLYSAWTRFSQGDVIGCVIDIGSALAGIIDFGVPGLGTGIAIGLDVFNAFLDYKAGGTPEGGGKGKGGMIMGWAADLGDWAWSKLKKIPFIKNLLNAVNHIMDGDIFEGLKSLSYCVGNSFGMLLLQFEAFVEPEEDNTKPTQTFANIFSDLFKWMKDSIYDKVANFAKKIGGSIKDAWNKMLGITETNATAKTPIKNVPTEANNTQSSIQNVPTEATTIPKGYVTNVDDFISRKNTPTFSISSEDSLIGFKSGGPIDSMLNKGGSSDNSKILGSIEKNTDNTNKALGMLANSLFKLIDVLNKQTANQGVNVYPKQIQQIQDKKSQALQSTSSAIDAVRNQFLNSIYTT